MRLVLLFKVAVNFEYIMPKSTSRWRRLTKTFVASVSIYDFVCDNVASILKASENHSSHFRDQTL